MKLNTQCLAICLAFLALGATVPSHAEHTAPVYDVDSMSNDSQSMASGSSSDENTKALNQVLTTSNEPPATVDQRVEQLEQQLSNLKQSDFSNRLNSLQGEIQALRGQVEELTHQLQDLRQQHEQQAGLGAGQNREPSERTTMSSLPRVNDEEADSPSKTTNKEVTKAGPTAAAKLVSPQKKFSSPEQQPNLAEEQAVYQTAYNLIKVKKYNEAIGALQKMLGKYPSGQSAANAHYWLGELYSLTGENERAAAEFTVVAKQYPNNPRVADAELKLGLINAALLKWPAAKASFKTVVSKYPGTPSARLAMEQLKLLKQSGH